MNVTRAQYAMIQSLVAAVRIADTAFIAEAGEQKFSSADIDKVAKHISEQASSRQIENCITILNKAFAEASQLDLGSKPH